MSCVGCWKAAGTSSRPTSSWESWRPRREIRSWPVPTSDSPTIWALALPPGGLDDPLPYELPANQAFLEAAKGLAWSLIELKQSNKAREVLGQLLACDPSDPLGAGEMLEGLSR